MPLFNSSAGSQPCDIYYEVRSCPGAEVRDEEDFVDVVLIMGFGATLQCWEPQLDRLLQPDQPRPTRCLLLDNRGVGRSGSPARKSAYHTATMAEDILLLMSIPRSWRALYYTLQMLLAREAEDRALVDLKFHFMHSTLDEVRSQGSRTGRTRWDLLAEEYVEAQAGGGMGQSNMGFKGQVHAVWSHRVSPQDISTIQAGRFPVLVIHGRHDLLAAPKFGEALAKRLSAPCVMLQGAHMLCRECGYHVNLLLDHIIYHAAQLVRRRHHYLDHSAGAQLPGPSSKQVQVDLQHGVMECTPSAPNGCLISPSKLERVREGTPDSEASATSHAELLRGQ